MNYAEKETERQLKKLEARIAEEYKKAAEASDAMAQAYFHKLRGRWLKEYEAFQNGVYTPEEFTRWYIAQVGRGKRWEQLRDDLAKQMTRTNEIAAAFINDSTPGIYSLNHDYTAYEISRKLQGSSFTLYNQMTAKRLLMGENHINFRVLNVDKERDYKWNTKQIQSALISGILRGQNIDQIAFEFYRVMGRNEAAAYRNARTAYTSAQNGGRLESMQRASDMGIKMQKEWISRHDARTRDSHGSMDGERVDVNEDFSNGLNAPGDPKGVPAEVYNCRCGMRTLISGINDSRRLTFEDWKKQLEGYYVPTETEAERVKSMYEKMQRKTLQKKKGKV